MRHRKSEKLCDKKTEEIDTKHKKCQEELSSEPCMNRIAYSPLSATEIMSEIRREYRKKPSEEHSTLEDNEKCQ